MHTVKHPGKGTPKTWYLAYVETHYNNEDTVHLVSFEATETDKMYRVTKSSPEAFMALQYRVTIEKASVPEIRSNAVEAWQALDDKLSRQVLVLQGKLDQKIRTQLLCREKMVELARSVNPA